MKKTLTISATLLLLSLSVHSDDSGPPNAAPAWFLEEIATLTHGSGRWITDNASYKNENEPYESYATEWKASFDGTSMTGRLYGIIDGKEVGEFWQFRQYWHPGRKEAIVEQFGWGGTVGIGVAWHEDGETKSDQSFFAVDGSVNRTGHISSFPDSSTHVTASFDIVGDEWQPRRVYTWLKDAGPEPAE
jgi:hypothetical protein